MTEAVIVSTVRTPIARARKGSLRNVDAFGLAQIVAAASIERSGIPVSDIDDLMVAEVYQGGGVIARNVAVREGLVGVPGLANNRHCASGLAAVATAAGSIRAGMDTVVLAGGTESLSTAPISSKPDRDGKYSQWMSEPYPGTPEVSPFDVPLTVGENTARALGLTRRDVDEWAVYTHQQAIASIDSGAFKEQIVPVLVTDEDGTQRWFDTDEHPRRDTTMESLAGLKLIHPEIDGATVTAGNSAGLNDAAAMVTVTSDAYADAHGLQSLARIRSWASVGIDPELTGLAPTLAIPKALDRAGLSISDVGLFEINEAFCSVPVAAVRKLGLDPSLVNVNGSGASLGHPIAATGARMVVTMVHELRRRGLSIGVVSMCAGGGMGMAMVLEIAS